jgi:hypothetical protein
MIVGTRYTKHDGIARGMQAFIAEEIHLTIPPPNKQIGIVERGQVRIVNDGHAKWFLGYYTDGNLCTAKRMPEDEYVTKGQLSTLYFEEYNI